AEADQVELTGPVARDRTAADPRALRLDQDATAINQQSTVAPVRGGRIRPVKAALLGGADEPRDRVVPVGENEVPGRIFPRLLAGAVPLDAGHIDKRKARTSAVLLSDGLRPITHARGEAGRRQSRAQAPSAPWVRGSRRAVRHHGRAGAANRPRQARRASE